MQDYDVDKIPDIFQEFLTPLPDSSTWQAIEELRLPVHLFESSHKGRMLGALKFLVLSFTSSTARAVIWVAGCEAVNSFLKRGRQ